MRIDHPWKKPAVSSREPMDFQKAAGKTAAFFDADKSFRCSNILTGDGRPLIGPTTSQNYGPDESNCWMDTVWVNFITLPPNLKRIILDFSILKHHSKVLGTLNGTQCLNRYRKQASFHTAKLVVFRCVFFHILHVPWHPRLPRASACHQTLNLFCSARFVQAEGTQKKKNRIKIKIKKGDQKK